MRTLNLGILAHVDAGKTSLTERLLYAAGVIDEIGSVDDGSTQTDSLALERQRGITIKSAVVSFAIDDVTVNLIDTPGHPDFIAEVERVLSVLDGAVLVVSAVEGVQAQTRVLMRALQRLRSRRSSSSTRSTAAARDDERVLRRHRREARRRRSSRWARRADSGTRSAAFAPYAAGDAGFAPQAGRAARRARRRAARRVRRRRDAALLPPAARRARRADEAGAGASGVLRLGDHRRGRGCADRRRSTELLPAAAGDADGPVSGTVFKIERGPAGEKVAYVRMLLGHGPGAGPAAASAASEGKVTAISVFERGSAVPRDVGRGGPDRQAVGSRRRSGSATRSAPRRRRGRRTSSRRRRSRRSSCRGSRADQRRAARWRSPSSPSRTR